MFGNSEHKAFIFWNACQLLTILVICQQAAAAAEFTNIKCEALDKSFADFEYCYIRAVNRTYKYMSLKVKLFQVPITNITVRVQLMKRTNGYKPFLVDVTFDGCKFQRERPNMLSQFIYRLIEKHTNMNHTCPFEHDLIVDKMDISFINNKITEVVPKPDGDYAIFTYWSAYGKVRANVKVFVTLK